MILVDHLSYRFEENQQPILDDIVLDIDENAFIVITGGSGCGKTTLALAICGFLFFQKKGQITGSVFLNGRDIRETGIGEISNDVYLVQQNPENQFCTLTVQDEIAFGLENQGMDPKIIDERIDWALQTVCAGDIRNRDLRTLSGGEQQKVAIATALALQPKAIILDEPTSFLDVQSTQNILEVLTEMREKEKLTLIIIEHKLAQIFPFQSKILNLKNGKLVPYPLDAISKKLLPRERSERKANPIISRHPVIEIIDMRIVRSDREILNVDKFQVNEGEFISLLGNNGSGKTSLLYAILGLINCEGEISKVFGKPIRSIRSGRVDGDIGMVFQNPNHQFFTDSVFEEMIFPIQNFSKQKILNSNWVNELINNFRLEEYRDFHPLKLSYGQKKRLSIASVLSYQPKLLLLDEIFIGQSVEEIIFILQQLEIYIREKTATIILVNHQPEIVSLFSDRTVILDEGKFAVDCPSNGTDPILEKYLRNEKYWGAYAH